MNSYLLESNDFLSIKLEREKIIKDLGFLDVNVNFYDLEEVLLETALEDLDTYGLFSERKVIVIQNIQEIKYDDFKNDFDHLIRYIDNPNPDYLLFIEAKKLNGNSKITKELKKKCKYKSISINSKDYIKNCFDGFKIDSSTISFLDDYCLGDLTKISSECEKLKNYKWDEKVITKNDIEELVVKKLGDSRDLTFDFSRSLAMRDIKSSLEKYRELLSYQLEPFSIIGLLSSQMRIIYQVKLLENDRLSDKEIARILEEKSDYRIKKTRELTRLYSEEELLLNMQKLADIDYKLKTSNVDANHLIELFIINY